MSIALPSGAGGIISQRPHPILASRVFTPQDQTWFASMSGDWNEIHTDPVMARRSMAGEQVVHGMHSAMWAMDSYLTERMPPVAKLSATFRKPVHLGETVDAVLVDRDGMKLRLSVMRDGVRLVDLRLELGEGPPRKFEQENSTNLDFPKKPLELTVDEIEGRRGTLPVSIGDSLAARFTHLTESVGTAVVAQLAAISRLVGMICPGRYSLLSGVDLNIDPAGSPSELEWHVDRVDRRVAAISISLPHSILRGTVQAFVRPSPTTQPPIGAVTKEVGSDEFRGQRALVVGGSRGLGELTTKILVAGGADVAFTWLNSEVQSARLVEEIRGSGRSVVSHQMDGGEPRPIIQLLARNGWVPEQIYYFATPSIFVRRTSFYDHRLFERFADVYLGGLFRVLEACRGAGAKHVTLFYPSSVAIEEGSVELVEYSAAKAAGEVAATALGAATSWLDVVVRRLPRLSTDQTATFLPIPAEDPMVLMPDLVREVQMLAPAEVGGSGHSE